MKFINWNVVLMVVKLNLDSNIFEHAEFQLMPIEMDKPLCGWTRMLQIHMTLDMNIQTSENAKYRIIFVFGRPANLPTKNKTNILLT